MRKQGAETERKALEQHGAKMGFFVDLRLACDLNGGEFELKKASAQR